MFDKKQGVPALSASGTITVKVVLKVGSIHGKVVNIEYQSGNKIMSVGLTPGELLTIEYPIHGDEGKQISVADALKRIKEELE